MEIEAVIEFLGHIPILQRLPSSSVQKIAEVVQFRHYKPGEYVVREGEIGHGVYFIWEGEAEISGSINFEGEDRSELQLKQYDYIGYGTVTSCHQADVIALSKPKSIWRAEETHETCSMVERILQLDPVEVNIFRGFTLPDAPRLRQVFGGQLALAAASKTVDYRKLVHSLHSYFLFVGDLGMPIIYQVHRLRDGNSFATRRVDAIQNGNVIFTLLASFQKEENGFESQEVTMPSVPGPDTLLSWEELQERRLSDPRLPRDSRNKLATRNIDIWPVDIRFCDPTTYTNQCKSPPSMKYWFKPRGRLSDDLALHRCVVAYTSDLLFSSISLNPHHRRGLKTSALSLDHSLSLLFQDVVSQIESPSASNGRGFTSACMFNKKGEVTIHLISIHWKISMFFNPLRTKIVSELQFSLRLWTPCHFIGSRGSNKESKSTTFSSQIKSISVLNRGIPTFGCNHLMITVSSSTKAVDESCLSFGMRLKTPITSTTSLRLLVMRDGLVMGFSATGWRVAQ
ncbi:Cyclic nucleotide-binding domain [Macleaya cordata]|uniref:Cyclic nucleotide-binding domain n=1 Tax=Macleaya cordata TaxID=56857 RepID=A0A200QU94_MACCD|nr:Cyclic nucleotide-binding domain [Macleaya cordata]